MNHLRLAIVVACPFACRLGVIVTLCWSCAGHAAEVIREEVKRDPEPVLTNPPTLVEFVEATYPKGPFGEGIQGVVELIVDLDAQGQVTATQPVASPHPELAEAAAIAVRKFRFTPAEVDGQPAPIRIRYKYHFTIETEPATDLPPGAPPAPQPDVLVGRVREQGTRVPIAGAAVALVERGIEVRTDGRGTFAVGVAPGVVAIQAVSPDHRTEKITAEIVANEQTRVDFYLVPLTTNPYETVVRGRRTQTTVSRITLKREQLTTVPGTFGDPIRVIQNLPGLARTPYVGGALLIRGAAPQDSGVFLDGIRIPLLFHFLGGPSVINPQFLQSIDYYAGNADVRYGRLQAGVVDVSTQDTLTQEWHGAAKIDFLDTSLYLNAPITENVTVAGAFRRSYIDLILPAIFNASGQEATTVVPVYYDYQARSDIRFSSDNTLALFAFGSFDDLAIVSNEPDQDTIVDLDSEVTFHRFHGQWRLQLGPRVSSRLAPYVGFDLVNVDLGTTNIDLKTWVAGLREDLDIRVDKRIRLRAGVDFELRHNTFDSQIPVPPDYRNPVSRDPLFTSELQRITVTQLLGGVGLYLDGIFQLTDRLQLIPGLRFDTIFYFGNARPMLSPRGTLRYRLLPQTTLKAGAGLFAQAPPPALANETFGNPNLSLEQAAHFSAGFEQQLYAAINLDIQLYYIHRFNQAVPTDTVIEDTGSFQRLNAVSSGFGRSYGMEALLKHEVTRHFYGWLAYTLAWSEQQQEEHGDLERFVFDQRHLLTLVASYRFGRGWEAGLRFRLATGRPEPALIDGVFDSDLGQYRGLTAGDSPLDGPLFHQLDLRVEKTWFFRLWRLAVFLDLQNVYNAPNPEATLYDYRFRESGPLRGLPILPTLGVKGAF